MLAHSRCFMAHLHMVSCGIWHIVYVICTEFSNNKKYFRISFSFIWRAKKQFYFRFMFKKIQRIYFLFSELSQLFILFENENTKKYQGKKYSWPLSIIVCLSTIEWDWGRWTFQLQFSVIFCSFSFSCIL